jgi:hypothetical protein
MDATNREKYEVTCFLEYSRYNIIHGYCRVLSSLIEG